MTHTPAVRVAGDDELRSTDDLSVARRQVEAVRDPDLTTTRAEMLSFVDAHDDALLRTCGEGHLTGSALVVDPASRRFLLLQHTKLRLWLQPGGHADGDGNLAAVALREATEETGIDGLRVAVPAIDLDVHLVSPPKETPHHHFDVRYLVLTPAGANAVGNHESTALRWVTIDEVDALGCDEGVSRMARTGLRALDELEARDQTSSGTKQS
jgi:8-oxo-dGTP pyrophosphatase MutT (NUDIX family)